MLITQKKQYALRAIYELAKQQKKGPIKSAQIAKAQAIPQRFLEIILNRLKHAGLVTAKRGYTGGFELKHDPSEITVEDVFKSLESADDPMACVNCTSNADCPFYGECAFMPVWTKLQDAIDQVCCSTTIQSLLDNCHHGCIK